MLTILSEVDGQFQMAKNQDIAFRVELDRIA